MAEKTTTQKSKNAVRTYNIRPDEQSLASYLKEIARFRPLKPEEEANLAAKIRKGDKKALEMLVKANLRFVVSVARNYESQGLPLCDLINEGNLGLIQAAKRFDEKKNFKFISYAVWWIRQAILQALADQSRLFKIPLNRVATVYRVSRLEQKLEQKLHRRPQKDEVAREGEIDLRNVQTAYRIGQTNYSLDKPVNEHGGSLLKELIEDSETQRPDEQVAEKSAREAVEKILEPLDEREKRVLKLYFGVGEDTPYTLEEIGRQLSLTRERVRQIKDRALGRLKGTGSKDLLNEFDW